jgi:hypothetical protein
METVTIKTFDNYFSANIILSRLQDAGIDCYLKDEYTVTIDPILSNAIGGIKLIVNSKDADSAARLLTQFEEEYLKSATCPKCGGNNIVLITKPGAGNIMTAILTWLFSSYAIAPEKIYQCQDCHYESISLPEKNKDDASADETAAIKQ